MSEIETKIAARLVELGVTYSAEGGQLTKRDNWDCYAWHVELRRAGKPAIETDFYCGLGHIKKRPRYFANNPIPLKPTAASVLYSLLMDGEALSTSFHDWCSESGADEDSRKSLATYDACCASGLKLRAFFTPAETRELREMLQDY